MLFRNRNPDNEKEETMDDAAYTLYVMDKIRKGRKDSDRGDTISIEALKKEVKQWKQDFQYHIQRETSHG